MKPSADEARAWATEHLLRFMEFWWLLSQHAIKTGTQPEDAHLPRGLYQEVLQRVTKKLPMEAPLQQSTIDECFYFLLGLIDHLDGYPPLPEHTPFLDPIA